jgi:hypothetical protein
MGIREYNNCMVEEVERIAGEDYGKLFNELPKSKQNIVIHKATMVCNGLLIAPRSNPKLRKGEDNG